jgi:hypothetical protein
MSEQSIQRATWPAWLLRLFLLSLGCLAGCVEEVKVFSGLKPAYPPAVTHGCTTVTSLQPTFRWQPYLEREGDEGSPSITAVTYQLRIWLEEHGAPGVLVYTREGVREPLHRIEDKLAPSKTYFWSVRANFLLNGTARVTDWGQQLFISIPIRNPNSGELLGSSFTDHQYYRNYCFQTPKESG